MAVHRTRNIYIRYGRGSTTQDLYSPIPEALHLAYAGGTETLDIQVAPALSGVDVDWIAVLPVPGDLGSWLVFEQNDYCVVSPDACLGTISTTRCNGRGPEGFLKGLDICLDLCVSGVNLWTVTHFSTTVSHSFLYPLVGL